MFCLQYSISFVFKGTHPHSFIMNLHCCSRIKQFPPSAIPQVITQTVTEFAACGIQIAFDFFNQHLTYQLLENRGRKKTYICIEAATFSFSTCSAKCNCKNDYVFIFSKNFSSTCPLKTHCHFAIMC